MARNKPQPIDWVSVPFPIVGGLDTKISGIALPPPKLAVCTNAYVDKTGRLRKREGSDLMSTVEMDGTTLGTLVALATHGERLLAMGDINAYEYSDSAGRWVDKSLMNSVRVDHRSVARQSETSALACDMATANGITAYAWLDANGQLLMSVVDDDGAVIVAEHQLAAAAGTPRCVTHQGKIYIFFYDPSGTPSIDVKILDTTSAALLHASIVGANVQVATDMAVVSANAILDAASSGNNGVLLAYRTTTANQVKWGFVSALGVLANTSTSATVANAIGLACAVAPAAVQHAIVYYVGTTPSDGYSLLRAWNGAAWSVTATSAALDTTLTAAITAITCAWEPSSNTTLSVWWSGDAATTTATDNNERTVQAVHTTGNVVTSRLRTFRHAQIASKPFQFNSSTYIVLGVGDALTSIQASLFLVNTGSNAVVGYVLKDVGFYGSNNVPMHGIVQTAGSSTFRFATIYKTIVPAGAVTVGKLGVMSIDMSFAHADSHKTVEAGGCLYLCGAMLQEYDGAKFSEANFLRLVESSKVVITPSAGAGALTSSVSYSYHIIPESTNSKGERSLGTNSGAITAPMGVGQNTNTISIPTITPTLKDDSLGRTSLVFGVYRAGPNPTSTSLYKRVGQVVNDITVDEVTFVDLMNDSTAATQEPFYRPTSAVLDNVAPPAAHIACSGGGRVFLAGMMDPSQVRASKLRDEGEPLAFNDAIKIQLPDEGGPIVALAFLNEQLVVFKRRRIYVVAGDGPNNTGFGEFFPPRLVSSDTGANTQRGVVLTPLGLFFTNEKGIFLLDQQLQVSYIGAPVEEHYPSVANGEVCLSAVLLPLKQQVRFTVPTGDLVYDYYHRQWYFFDYNVGPVGPAVLWNNSYVFPAGSQNVRREDHSLSVPTYYDVASNYTMTVRLAWLTAPGPLKQGDIRVRRVGVLIESLGEHNAQVHIYKDFETSVAAETLINETALAAGIHFLEERLLAENQLVSSLQVEIEDSGTDGTASMAISEIAFEVGVRSRVLGRSSSGGGLSDGDGGVPPPLQ